MARATLRTQNTDGDAVSLDIHVEDDHADESVTAVERYAELQAEVAAAEHRSEAEAAQQDLDAVKEVLVSEIVRRKTLAGIVSEDDDADLSVEDERDYLMGLPAERLQMEWERAPSGDDLSGATQPATQGGVPKQEGSPADATSDFS